MDSFQSSASNARRDTLIWEGFKRFEGSLTEEERQDVTISSADELIATVNEVDKTDCNSNRAARIIHAFIPLIQFLDRNSRAIDNFVQVQPMPCAIIWGLLRTIFEVGQYLIYINTGS